jgi:hypothetical protein
MSIYCDYPNVRCDHCGEVTMCRAVVGGFNKINAPLCRECFNTQLAIFHKINLGELTLCQGSEQFGISYELMKERLFDYNDIKHPELCKEEARKRDLEYMDLMFIESILTVMEDNWNDDVKLRLIQRVIDTFKEGEVEPMSRLLSKINREYVEHNQAEG